jgi:hypothetical protein
VIRANSALPNTFLDKLKCPASSTFIPSTRKYYADKDYRQRWHNDWPSDVIRPHEDPAYNRDAKLPKPARG